MLKGEKGTSENAELEEDNDLEKNKQKKGLFEQTWAFFSSMRLGIALLLILAAMSFYGATFMEHQVAMEVVYKSWWFVGTLALTGLNLLVCSYNRWNSIWVRATVLRTNISFKTLSHYKNQEKFSFKGEANENITTIAKTLKGKGYRTAMNNTEGGILLSADKGRYGHFGSLITHLSIVLLLLAGLHGVLGGFEGFEAGFPGRVFSVGEAGFSVRIDDFKFDFRDDERRTIAQYYSTLTVINEGEEVKQETIYVNRPLRYRGVAIYQATYGWGVDLAVTNVITGAWEEGVILIPEQTYHHPATGSHLHIIDILPYFSKTEQGIPFSRSPYPGNFHVVYRLFDGEGNLVGTPFNIEPLGHQIMLSDEHMIEFVAHRNFTGFQIVKDPGKYLALVASVLMIIGLFMSFYLYPRRIWCYVGEKTEDKLLFVGQSHRNKVGFKMEFRRLVDEIKKNREG